MTDIGVVAARKGRMQKGFYVARMRRWPRFHSWVVVQVVPIMLGDEREFVVQEAGRPGFTETREWEFRNRILGLCEIKRPENPHIGGPFPYRDRYLEGIHVHFAS
jgi:hypothetical protein